MQELNTKVLVVGAGPAGSMASVHLSLAGIPHILADQVLFPRDKICGDALSGKVFNELKRAGIPYPENLLKSGEMSPCYGIRFTAPGAESFELPFKLEERQGERAPGAVCGRMAFDHYLFQQALKHNHRHFLLGRIVELEITNHGGIAIFKNEDQKCRVNFEVILAADGDKSLIARKYANKIIKPETYSAGLRQYYQGVKDLHPRGYIELIFLKDLLPGYLWIFPMGNGKANVGAGMLKKDISERKINLREWMQEAITKHPVLKERFRDAVPLEEVRGWGLPLGGNKNQISGNRFLLLGDAASLIDPFTGEGIANAMISGRVAAGVCAQALLEKRLDAAYLKEYDRQLYKKVGSELRLSKWIQKLVRYPALMNFVFKRAASSAELRKIMTMMFDDVNMRKQLRNPLFYIRLLGTHGSNKSTNRSLNT